MLQRIQTIYLILAGIFISLTFYFSFATYSISNELKPFTSLGFNPFGQNIEIFPLYILVIISSLLIAISIISFKNRKRQIFINTANYFVLLALMVLVFINFNVFEPLQDTDIDISYGASLFFPIVSFVLVLMANRAVKNDEKLIKSMDRIR